MHLWPIYQFAKYFTPGNRDTWLQFWGSYFGFIPTGLITFMVLEFQFKRQESIDKNNFEEQLKKQKQEFLFEKDYEDLTMARNLAMSIWLASSEIIFVCESVKNDSDRFDDMFNELSKQYEVIKKNHNELVSWNEEQLNSKKENPNYYKIDKTADKAREQLLEIRKNMKKKRIPEALNSAISFRKHYLKIKNTITLEKISVKKELTN